MIVLTAIFVVLTGLAFGSFLNVCIERLPRGESVVRPGSRCPRCRIPIRKRDNIPLLSWLLLRGRCRACGEPIPRRYPAIEAAIAALFAACWLQFGLTAAGAGAAVFCFLLVGLAAMDAETLLLPDAFTLPGIGLGLLFAALAATPGSRLAAAAASLLAALLAFGLVSLIRYSYRLLRRREGMGAGDAKLMAMIAAWLGWERTLLVFFLAVVAGAVFALVLLAWMYSKGTRGQDAAAAWAGSRLPFGTLLSAAALCSLFFGWPLIRWYLGFFPQFGR